MKNFIKKGMIFCALMALAALVFSCAARAGATLDNPSRQNDPTRASAYPMPGIDKLPPPPPGPLMRILDTNKDGRLSAAEIANASRALSNADTNGDGMLSRNELRPRPPRRIPKGPGETDGTIRSHYIIQTPEPTAHAYPIVDTGQTAFYGNFFKLPFAPTSPNDPFYGQDAQYSGHQPAYRDNGDGTITDLNTGLMWVKARGSKVSWATAKAGAAKCTVGGYTDWRMPTVKELYSLINFNGKSGRTDATCIPYIDTRYFDFAFGDTNSDADSRSIGSRVIDGQDWSATQYVSTTMKGNETVFGVNFIDGRIKGYPVYNPRTGEPTLKYVRYVRGNPDYGVNHFVDNGDGTITDTATGLMWAKADSGKGMNWPDALTWVQQQNAVNYLGHNDWRLPNAKELQSIVDYTRSPDTTDSAAIDPLFQCTAITNEGGQKDYPFYWTGTTHLDNMGAVYIAFGRALGWMDFRHDPYLTLADVHGAGAQRSDPKTGNVADYYLGQDANGNPAYGRGSQGDVIRIDNFVRLVRDAK